jgi:cysteine-S-conjugate beta-lyase
MKPRTRLIHAGRDRDPYTGASSIPIYQTSTFAQEDPDHPPAYDYARGDNPTREALELAIAELEGGSDGFAFGSGMAAISSALMLLNPGDHVIATNHIYGGTYRALTSLFRRWKLNATFVDCGDIDAVRAAVQPDTRALFVETPANPLQQITDLRAMVEIAREHQLLTMIDNTFMSPYLQRPLELGFDIVLHSATKFIGGHSDLLAGLAVTREPNLGKQMKRIQNTFGAILGPQDAWLTLRGLKTLGVRMDAQQAAARRLADWLQTQDAVEAVYFPGLPEHPGAALHASQADGPGAVVSFALRDGAAAMHMLKTVEIPLVAVSLGGVESILSYPAKMSHAAMPPAERQARGISDGLLRLSVGLEDPDDLITDLQAGLQAGL